MTKRYATKKRLSLLLAVLMLVVSVFVAYPNGAVQAQSVEELQKEQQKLEAEQDRLKKEIAGLDSKAEAQKKLKDNIESQIATLENQINAFEDEIVTLNKESEKLGKKKDKDIAKYKDRFREMYMSHDDSVLAALLNSESFSEYLVQQDAIDRVYQSDEKMLQEVIDSILKIEENKKQVEKNKKEIEKAKPALDTKKQEYESAIADIMSLRTKSAAELDEIQRQRDEDDARIAALLKQKAEEKKQREEEKKKEQENNSGGNTEKPKPDGSGSEEEPAPPIGSGWQIPVNHSNPYATCLFGDDWIEGAYRFHYGIDYSGYEFTGTPIVATKGGEVILAEWFGGYGNCVIVSHGTINGNDMYSVYGHLDYISVSEGQQVGQGQKLGGGGDTGYSFGAHLHFEIRESYDKEAGAVDPEKYVAKLPRRLV